jgi:hypothetical protein
VYAAGQCHLTASTRELHCSGVSAQRLTGQAPHVRGHPAFWAPSPYWQGLAWQYARGGWAVLYLFFPARQSATWHCDALKVADHLRYGAHAAPPLAFPAQLTGVPASWQVNFVEYHPYRGLSQVFQYQVRTGQTPGYSIVTQLASARTSCQTVERGQWAREVIHGYQAIVSRQGSFQTLCAPHADGLKVMIIGDGFPGVDVAGLFRHHLLLLGTNPANWTRNPIR